MIETYKLYGGTVCLTFDPDKHIYTVDGERVDGVTGVVSVIAKPALIYWSVNMALSYIGKKIKAGKSYDEIQLKKILEGAKIAHKVKKEDAGDIGTLVHEAIERYILTGKEEPPVHEKAKVCYENFINWAKENKVRFIETERKVYSKEYNYAGTMDFACVIGDKTFVGDIKTSNAIYNEYWFQTSAYQQAYTEETGTKIDGQLIVRVSRNGDFEIQENYDYEENVQAFNGALVLYRRIQQLKDNENAGV